MLIEQKVVHDAEDAVCNGDHGFLRTMACRQSAELRGQVGLGARRRVRRFDQSTSKPPIAFARLAAASLPGAFILPRAKSSPGCQVAGGGKAAHIGTDLGDDDLGSATTNARDGVEAVKHQLKRALTFSDFSAQSLDRFIQKVDVGQNLRHQKALMRTKPSCQCSLENAS